MAKIKLQEIEVVPSVRSCDNYAETDYACRNEIHVKIEFKVRTSIGWVLVNCELCQECYNKFHQIYLKRATPT